MKLFARRRRDCVYGSSAEAEWNDATRGRDRVTAMQQTVTESTQANVAQPIVHDLLRSPGQALDPKTRALLEPRFGHDFGRVQVHADVKAVESAQLLNARAYTVGPHVSFGGGEYQPSSEKGLQLLAHELAHVVQQREAMKVQSK